MPYDPEQDIGIGDKITLTSPNAGLAAQEVRIIVRRIRLTRSSRLMEFECVNKRLGMSDESRKATELGESHQSYQSLTDPTHSHTVTGATASSSDTGENLNITQGSMTTTAVATVPAPVFITATVPTSPTGTDEGANISVSLFNGTGVVQTNAFVVTNLTSATILTSGSFVALANNAQATINLSVSDTGPFATVAGDLIEFKITSGTVGTAGGNFFHGYLLLSIAAKSSHDHTISGQTGVLNDTDMTG